MKTKRLRCTCKHEYQDRRYGPQVRVHNKMVTPKDHPDQYRCTVCGEERTG